MTKLDKIFDIPKTFFYPSGDDFHLFLLTLPRMYQMCFYKKIFEHALEYQNAFYNKIFPDVTLKSQLLKFMIITTMGDFHNLKKIFLKIIRNESSATQMSSINGAHERYKQSRYRYKFEVSKFFG